MFFNESTLKEDINLNKNLLGFHDQANVEQISYTQFLVSNILEKYGLYHEEQEGYFWSILLQQTRSIFLYSDYWTLIYQNKDNQIKESVKLNKDDVCTYKYCLPFNYSNNTIKFWLTKSLNFIREISLKHIDINHIKSCSLMADGQVIDSVSSHTLKLYNQYRGNAKASQAAKNDDIVIPFFPSLGRQFFPIGLDVRSPYSVLIECFDDHMNNKQTTFHDIEFCVETLKSSDSIKTLSNRAFDMCCYKISCIDFLFFNNRDEYHYFNSDIFKLRYLVFPIHTELIDKIEVEKEGKWHEVARYMNNNYHMITSVSSDVSFFEVTDRCQNKRFRMSLKEPKTLLIPFFSIHLSMFRCSGNLIAEYVHI